MASEKTINGNYGGHQPYPQAEPFLPSQGSNVSSGPAAGDYGDEASAAPTAAPAEPAGAVDGKPFSKDEVGWYFVESYYTTLSKNPETLHVRLCFIYSSCSCIPGYHSLQVFSSTTINDPSSSRVTKLRR